MDVLLQVDFNFKFRTQISRPKQVNALRCLLIEKIKELAADVELVEPMTASIEVICLACACSCETSMVIYIVVLVARSFCK